MFLFYYAVKILEVLIKQEIVYLYPYAFFYSPWWKSGLVSEVDLVYITTVTYKL